MTFKTRQTINQILVYLGVFVVLVAVLGPYMWMVSGSFKDNLEVQASDVTKKGLEPSWIPRKIIFDNYRDVNKTVRILDYFKNSIIISVGTMFTSIVISILAGYGLSRFRFKGKNLFTVAVLSTQMFPGIAFLIPYFILFSFFNRNLGIPLNDTYLGMIITYTSFALPFCILMLRNFLDSVPFEIDEQAQIDGCTKTGALFRVIIPLSTPGIAAVGIYSFIMAWNEILFASVLTGRETKPVSMGLLEYITAQASRWAQMMAACIVVSIPVLILFTAMQKQIVEGLVSGATKG